MMATRKRLPDSPQMGLLGLAPTPAPVTMPLPSGLSLTGVGAVPATMPLPSGLSLTGVGAVPANDDEDPCPPVLPRAMVEMTDNATVTEWPDTPHPYVISYVRHNGTHYGSMCLSASQLKQILTKGAELLGSVAIDLDELDDHNSGNEEYEDE